MFVFTIARTYPALISLQCPSQAAITVPTMRSPWKASRRAPGWPRSSRSRAGDVSVGLRQQLTLPRGSTRRGRPPPPQAELW